MELSFIEKRISTITLTLDILSSTQQAIVEIGLHKGFISPNDFNEVNTIDRKIQKLSKKLDHMFIIKDGLIGRNCSNGFCLN